MARTHTAPNPFPRMASNERIMDELCRCGQLRSAHKDVMGLAFGHGPSFDGKCAKFTWASMVMERKKEKA